MDNEKYTTDHQNANKLKAGFLKYAGNIGPAFIQFIFNLNNGDYMTPLTLRYDYWKTRLRERLRNIKDDALFSLSDSFTPSIIANEFWNDWVVSIGRPELVHDVKITEDFLVEKITRQHYYLKNLDARYMPEILHPILVEYSQKHPSERINVKDEKRHIEFEGELFNEIMRGKNLSWETARKALKDSGFSIQDEKKGTTAHRTFTINGEKSILRLLS